MEDGNPIPVICIGILLWIICAVVSYARTALDNVNEQDMKKDIQDGNKKAEKVLKLKKTPNQYKYANQIVQGITYSCSGIVFMFVLVSNMPVLIEKIVPNISETPLLLYKIVLFCICIFLLLSLCTNVPKKLAYKDPKKGAYNTLNIISSVIFILYPFIILTEWITNWILTFIFGMSPNELGENVTEQELISMVNEVQERGILEASEAEMISNIMELDNKEVKDIMTHRKHIIALESKLSVEDALNKMIEENYSRFPLYEENLDNIIGILHLKDVTRYYILNKGRETSLRQLARKPLFIPDTKNIDIVFNEMQAEKIHMAIAIDEYGQTAGLVAMEDVLEEIVGNIFDEYDDEEEEHPIIKQGNGRYMMKGLTSLKEVEEELDIEAEGDFETLNGLLVSILGRIPNDGERPVVKYQGYAFRILDVENKMVGHVKVSKLPGDQGDKLILD